MIDADRALEHAPPGLEVDCEPSDLDGLLRLRVTSPDGSAAFTGTAEQLWAITLVMADAVAGAGTALDLARFLDDDSRASGSTGAQREGAPTVPAPAARAGAVPTSPGTASASMSGGAEPPALPAVFLPRRAGEQAGAAPPDGFITATCRNCGLPVRRAPGGGAPYWYHPGKVDSVWCSGWGDPAGTGAYAEPEAG